MNEPKVTLTIGIDELCDLYAGGNRTCPTPDPLSLALDIIEHAAETLHMVHDSLRGNPDGSQEIANYAWRASRQLTTGIAIVEAFKKNGGAS